MQNVRLTVLLPVVYNVNILDANALKAVKERA